MRDLFLEKNYNEVIHVRDTLHFVCEKCGVSVTRKGLHFNGKLLCKSCNMKVSTLEKYGVENYSQTPESKEKAKNREVSQETKEKRKQTCLRKYGVENPLQLEEIQESSKKKIIEKFGYYGGQLHTDKANQKRKETCLEKYGVESPLASKEIQDKISPHRNKFTSENNPIYDEQSLNKIIQTNLVRYGCENPMSNESIRNKAKETMLKKYGYDCIFKRNKFRETIEESFFNRTGKNLRDEIARHRKPKYIYDDTWFDSLDELAFWIWNKDNFFDIKRPDIKFEYYYNNEKHFYYPDFQIDDKYIEIKGPQFLKDDGTWQNPYNHELDSLYEAKRQCALKNDVTILYNCEQYIEYVNKKYTKDFMRLFKESIPFPYLNENLKDKSDSGIMKHFHKSIYEAKKLRKPSPLEAWENKNIIKIVALNRLKYVGKCKPSDIIQGFSVTRVAPKISLFSPKLAETLIKKYCDDCNTIIDPFSGFSGRLIGAVNCSKTYRGYDINEKHVHESNEIIQYKDYKNCSVAIEDLINAPIRKYSNDCCLFTCPPYGGKEHWNKDNDEVEKTCDEWIDLCLEKHRNCKRYVFIVDKTEKYKDNIIETLKEKDGMFKHFGEFVIII